MRWLNEQNIVEKESKANRWDGFFLMKITRGRKTRDTVSLKGIKDGKVLNSSIPELLCNVQENS
jgi:hypothetical protein